MRLISQKGEWKSMSIKAFDTSLEGKLIKKINELYITTRKKYLILSPKTVTSDTGEKNIIGKYLTLSDDKQKFVPLNDSLIRRHLQGKQTIGVFSGEDISKFLCFDLDFPDDTMKAKWVYRHLIVALNEIGIENKHIHTSFSGSKGYHVEIFIQNGTSVSNLIMLFNRTMDTIKKNLPDDIKFNIHSKREHYGEFGQIEMRPSFDQGVKIPLGLNFNNRDKRVNNKCVFLDNETLQPVKDDYLLSINPIGRDEFSNIMMEFDDIESESLINVELNEIKSNIKEPHSHKINKDETITIQHIIDLIQNGLHMSSTRHNSCLKISKYFRYMGLSLEDAITQLQEWMRWQDSKYYSCSLTEALVECDRICRIVYEKEYQLFGNVDNIKIYKSELKEIINIDNKYDKILLHTMLIHSKRYSLKNKVFYMTFKQITEMSGISANGAKVSIERLEELGYLKVVSRNVRHENSHKHKPNKYMITLNSTEDDVVLEIDNTPISLNANDVYLKGIVKAFTNDELKHLPNRQYREITKFRNSILVG